MKYDLGVYRNFHLFGTLVLAVIIVLEVVYAVFHFEFFRFTIEFNFSTLMFIIAMILIIFDLGVWCGLTRFRLQDVDE